MKHSIVSGVDFKVDEIKGV